jgi:hypothetical protein
MRLGIFQGQGNMTASLFDHPRSRRSDPQTSHDAAEHVAKSGLAADQQKRVLAAVVRWPGRTASELAENARAVSQSTLTRYDFGRRLPELRRRGLVPNGPARTCRVTRRQAMVWKFI